MDPRKKKDILFDMTHNQCGSSEYYVDLAQSGKSVKNKNSKCPQK